MRMWVALWLGLAVLGMPAGPLWAAESVEGVGWPSAAGDPVLNSGDVRAYKALFAKARRGVAPTLAELNTLDNRVLVGHVKALRYASDTYCATFDELAGWLKQYSDLPEAVDIYRMAEARRPVVEWRTVEEKVKLPPAKKKKGKKGKKPQDRYKIVTKKVPARYADMPPRPLALLKRDEAREAQQEANEEALARLSPEGRNLSGQVWRLRGKGDYAGALAVLMQPGAPRALTVDRWQAELVRLATYWHGKKNWEMALRAAEAAGAVAGGRRDDALWLAGFASYRMGYPAKAAALWSDLVRRGSPSNPHYAQAGWWAARAYREIGQPEEGRDVLELAAKDGVSFYGQLAAEALGRPVRLNWDEPAVSNRGMAALLDMPAAQRGLALAQMGEVSMAQKEFRLIKDDVPEAALSTLASVALSLHLPATALQAGRALWEQGTLLPAALFPVPTRWQPKGGGRFDRALMLGIMRQESAFMPAAGSRVGAQGLMQIMPATANYVCRMNGDAAVDRKDLHNPDVNLAIAQDYLNYLSGKLGGNLVFVVASYNGGMGNVLRWKANRLAPMDDPLLFIESIPFVETKDYVQKVLANYWVYQQRMGIDPWTRQELALERWPRAYALAGGDHAS